MTTILILLAFMAGANIGFVLNALLGRAACLIGPMAVAAGTGLVCSLAWVNR